jgi:hypothetical protein
LAAFSGSGIGVFAWEPLFIIVSPFFRHKLDRTQKDRTLFYTQIDKLGKPEKFGTRIGNSIVVTEQCVQKEESIAEKVVDAAFKVYKLKVLGPGLFFFKTFLASALVAERITKFF